MRDKNPSTLFKVVGFVIVSAIEIGLILLIAAMGGCASFNKQMRSDYHRNVPVNTDWYIDKD